MPITNLPFLNEKFLQAMNEIGEYGHQKYGENSFHARAEKGDKSRGVLGRCESEAIWGHACDHFAEYMDGVKHDHFVTRRHQLAAVAFNAMMEFYFAGLEDEADQHEQKEIARLNEVIRKMQRETRMYANCPRDLNDRD